MSCVFVRYWCTCARGYPQLTGSRTQDEERTRPVVHAESVFQLPNRHLGRWPAGGWRGIVKKRRIPSGRLVYLRLNVAATRPILARDWDMSTKGERGRAVWFLLGAKALPQVGYQMTASRVMGRDARKLTAFLSDRLHCVRTFITQQTKYIVPKGPWLLSFARWGHDVS